MHETLRVDIWSDIACPWCYLGKHRFEAGLAQFRAANPEVDVEVEGRSYELAPDTPDNFSGNEVDFLTKYKGMPREHVEEMLDQMRNLGSVEGITFDWNNLNHVNTSKLHRVLHLAKDQRLYSEMQERLFAAYFSEGRNLADPEVVAELGEEIGLDADEVRDSIEDETYAEAVEADTARARMLGVTGVPFFLIEGKYGVSGAQTVETFAGALQQVLELQRSGEEAD